MAKQKYECDGCYRVVELDNPPTKTCGCKYHWGWLEVGSKAWHDLHDEGIHPMSGLVQDIKAYLKRN
jgi:hypothetical protein